MKHFYLSLIILGSTFNSFAQTIEKDTVLAREYMNAGKKMRSNSNYDEAMDKFNKAKSIYSNYKLDELYFTCELERAAVMISKDEFTEALSILNSGKAAIKTSKGENNALFADFCNKKGLVYFYAGEYPNAKDEWIKAMVIRKKIYGSGHIKVADSYNNIGSLYITMGEYYSGLKLHQKALKIRKEKLPKNDLRTASSLMYIGNIYLQMSNPDLALEYFLQSLKIKQYLLKSDDPELAALYKNLALVFYKMDEFNQSKKYYKKALNTTKNKFGEDHPKTADIYNGFAKVLNSIGEYDKALEYHMKALFIYEEKLGKQHPYVSKVLKDIGITYLNQDEFDKAKEYFTLATTLTVNTFGSEKKEVAQFYIELGNIYYNKVVDLTPMNFFFKALNIQEKIYKGVHPDIAETYMQIGTMYKEQEEYYDAIENYKKCLDLRIQIFGNKHQKTAEIYYMMARLYEKKSDLSSAQKYLQKALKSNIKEFNSDNIRILPDLKKSSSQVYDRKLLLKTLSQKAEVFKKVYFRTNSLEDLKDAYKVYKRVGIILSQVKQSSTNKQERRELKKVMSENYDKAITICMLLFKKTNDSEYFNKAFEFSEKNKAGIMTDVLSNVDLEEFAGVPDSIIQYEKDLSGDIFYFRKRVIEETEDLKKQNKLVELEKKYDGFISMTKNQYEDYYSLKFAPYNISVSDIQDLTDDSTMMISYFTTKISKFLYVFTIRKNSVHMYFMNKADGYDSNVKNFKTLLLSDNGGNKSTYRDKAHKLYEILMPSDLENDNSINKLIILPDDKLVSVPFEALLTEEYTGNINSYSDYPYLIKKYGLSYFYTGNLFHKTFYEDTLLMSEDTLGISEYFEFDNLSVLPSSETELVNDEKGEGVIGLTYALLYEEIKNIIASLWQFSDIYTEETMTEFYEDFMIDYEESEEFSHALRKAKLKLIKEGKYARPFYWSPFVLIGK